MAFPVTRFPSPRMMPSTESGHHAQIYTAISLALALPVLLWPLAWLSGNWLETGAEIQRRWLAAAVCLLMAAVVADSILSGMRNNREILSGTTWIIFTSLIAGLAFRTPFGLSLIASLFGLHALRSGVSIWKGKQQWWLWPAWVRDTGTALILFGWLAFFGYV